ncbi:carbon storage regulator [Paenibacillus sp. LjRoot153]|uniref:carbon storage regulator n=1 Tax=Paenibacillus sp. LjRoot153 TaxID=3342270 RepID=UPI003ECC427B
MLVLGRKPGEYVMIGHSIKVQVIKSKDGDLRLAITAPKEVSILRGEIYDPVNDEMTSSPFSYNLE